MTVTFPDNVQDLVHSSILSGIENLGFQAREVHFNFPPPVDDFQTDRAIMWSAEVEFLMEEDGSETEIMGNKFKNVAPKWVRISSRIHFLPTIDNAPVDSFQISQATLRSAAFTTLVAMREDRHFIYRAIQDYGINRESLFVAEAIRYGIDAIDTQQDVGGRLLNPAKAIAYVCDFVRISIMNPISSHYQQLKSELSRENR